MPIRPHSTSACRVTPFNEDSMPRTQPLPHHRHSTYLFHRVRRDDHAPAHRLLRLHDVPNLPARLRIQASRRFIQKHDAWRSCQHQRSSSSPQALPWSPSSLAVTTGQRIPQHINKNHIQSGRRHPVFWRDDLAVKNTSQQHMHGVLPISAMPRDNRRR